MRLHSRAAVPIALGMSLLILVVVACSGSDQFHGTVIRPEVAPPFELVDQHGRPAILSDSNGRVVVLAFLYTTCPDICPLTTEALRRAHQLLGEDAGQVDFMAVTVDPDRDSIERARQYTVERGMEDRWRFLVGTEDQLKPVWRSYWLDPIRNFPANSSASHDDDHGGTVEDDGPSDPSPVPGYLVSHTAPVFLIDRDGYRRVLFTSLDLDPRPLVHDVRLLLRQ